jgi:hypothetical protein
MAGPRIARIAFRSSRNIFAKGISMKTVILSMFMAFAIAGGRLAADPVAPQYLFNLGVLIGGRTAPPNQEGHGEGGGTAGFEYIPALPASFPAAFPRLGFDLDYDNIAVGRLITDRDNDLDLSLRAFSPNAGPYSGWLQAGIGFNTSINSYNGHYLGFIEPGMRWLLFPCAAMDAGIQYRLATPSGPFAQALLGTLSLSIPLDARFGPAASF